MTRPPARLWVLLARDAPVAAVLRSGPTRWTCVLRWDTDTDEITEGDWIDGGLAVEGCDLSSDGRHLLYRTNAYAELVGGEQPGGMVWTAISKLPSLRPLLAWPRDDSWGGDGYFLDDQTVWIRDAGPTPATSDPPFAMADVDDSLSCEDRAERDGWTLASDDRDVEGRLVVRLHQEWTRPVPGHDLDLRWHTGHEESGRVRPPDEYRLRLADGAEVPLDVAWAGIDRAGRLVGVRRGCLVALHPRGGAADPDVEVIVDLDPLQPPEEATEQRRR